MMVKASTGFPGDRFPPSCSNPPTPFLFAPGKPTRMDRHQYAPQAPSEDPIHCHFLVGRLAESYVS